MQKTSETLHHLWNAISIMAYSNKVYAEDTQDKGGVAKEEFHIALPRSIPVCTGYQQTGKLPTGRKQPLC